MSNSFCSLVAFAGSLPNCASPGICDLRTMAGLSSVVIVAGTDDMIIIVTATSVSTMIVTIFFISPPTLVVGLLSVQPLCSLCLSGDFSSRNYHRDTENTEVAQRRMQ